VCAAASRGGGSVVDRCSQTVSALGAPGGAYVNVLFGRRMFFEKPATNRAGTLLRSIDMNVSFLRISSSRESTQRFSAVFPCLIPIPYGRARNVSFVSFAD
jgi:hypothetical protein